jgi:hypothetical protein
LPEKVTYSDTMLAFQAAPAAVISPVTRYGNIPGSIGAFHLANPRMP